MTRDATLATAIFKYKNIGIKNRELLNGFTKVP